MNIINIYRKKRPVFSVEFFPPKNGDGLEGIFDTLECLEKFKIDYFSVTSGALGSQRGGTIAIAAELKRKYGLEALVHLTCANKSKQDLENLLMEIKYHGLQNVLALRGDPEKAQREFLPHPSGHRYAFELVKQINRLNQGNYLSENDGIFRRGLENDFLVAVAGYPEGHLECPDLKKNLEHLKIKVESGADFVITQLFFDADKFLKFREEAFKAGINIPLIPGFFPLSNFSEINFISRRLGVNTPKDFREKIEANKKDAEAVREICREHNILIAKKLLEEDAPGIHFFTMNRSAGVCEILEEITDKKFRSVALKNKNNI